MGADMTAAVTMEDGQVAVFVAVDHCSAECAGIHAALRGTRHEALELVRQGVTARFGERLIERYGHRLPPRFRRDQMDSQTMAAQMQTDVSEAGGGTTP